MFFFMFNYIWVVKAFNINIMNIKSHIGLTNIGGPNISTTFLKECFLRSGIIKLHLSRSDVYDIFSVAIEAYVKTDRDIENVDEENIKYFLIILRNKVSDFLRAHSREQNAISGYINEQISTATNLLKISQEKLDKLVHRMIQNNDLPKHCSKILEAIFERLNEGKKYNEISNNELAEQLNFTLNYLRNRKSYCLNEIKKLYIIDPIIKELY